jgi:hypothetical protein
MPPGDPQGNRTARSSASVPELCLCRPTSPQRNARGAQRGRSVKSIQEGRRREDRGVQVDELCGLGASPSARMAEQLVALLDEA